MTETEKLKQAINLLKVARCPECDGSGEVVVEVEGTDAGCCGNLLPSGECCGIPVPIQTSEQGLFPCQWCYEKDELIKSETECKHGESLEGCCNACADSGVDPRKGHYIWLDGNKRS